MEPDSPLMVYVASTLLDGSLLRPLTPGDGDSINGLPPRSPQKLFEQRVALSGLLSLLVQDRELWPLVEQHVDQSRAMREHQAKLAADKAQLSPLKQPFQSRQSLDASQAPPLSRPATPASDEFTRQRMARLRNGPAESVPPSLREPGE